jgi:DNA-binding MarR family transcriptional regulator
MPKDHGQDGTRQITLALGRLNAYLRGAAWQAAWAGGLTPTQAEILSHLVRQGPARNTDLAGVLGVTAATLSASARALVEKGLVARAPDPDDARVRRLSLTTKGAEAVAGLPPGPPALDGALAAMPPDRRGAFLRHLAGLLEALEAARAIPPQRMCLTCRHFRGGDAGSVGARHGCGALGHDFDDAGLRVDCPAHEGSAATGRAG